MSKPKPRAIPWHLMPLQPPPPSRTASSLSRDSPLLRRAASDGTGTANVRDIYLRQGADEAYGVPLAAVRAVAKAIGKNHALGLELWKTGVHEARIVACSILDARTLTEKEARALIGSARYAIMNDELVSRVITEAPFAAELGVALRAEKDDYLRRAGWKILSSRIADGHEARASGATRDEPAAVLARLEKEMPSAPFRVKEGMNY